ncbi:hypothetical protein A3733_24880 [Pseudoalteromonas shioyasakiensis]|nr:hypothetical protein A3733_24880 [Pseudoalteromonas shioyasakiensis]
MSKFRVEETQNSKVYIHNDLSNAAHFLKESAIKSKEGNGEGLSLIIMGSLTMYAFSLEARINFIGSKTIENWNERKQYIKKLKKILKSCDIPYLPDERPFTTLNELKKFRDLVAHGKPLEVSESEVKVLDRNEEKEFKLKDKSTHFQLCNLNFLSMVEEDIQILWRDLLKGSGIEPRDTITTFSGSQHYLGDID